ncbi:HAD-IIB family hydrolase [Streptomyces capoamus]|uniref:HAD-IIB family hydrolase n=1 Tax=Streptomyces capoamus TaxID=68183 RepID=UPI003394F183
MRDRSGLARVLVTDLDGTLLEGDASDRRRLRDELKQNPDITLVFATGRGLTSVQQLLQEDPLVPPPRWIIADVGASVIDAVRTVRLQALETRLRTGWPGAHRVRAALRRFPQLVYQEGVSQEGRCSYYLHPENLSDDLTAAVKELGCSFSYASGRYFDVLPAGASKGRALHLLAHRLGWAPQAMLVAGDSLNDLSLFCLGTHGVVVANAEPGLTARAPASARIHLSSLDGAAAVLEGMQRLGWLPRRSSVVIGYHRPPVRWVDGAWQTPSSPNGILPTLRSALADKEMDAVWAAAHPGEASPTVLHEPVTDGLSLSLLPLRPQQWQGYFHRVCKETLWPALMSQPHLIQDRSAHWADYEQVNVRFAHHISSLAAQNGTVWLHDYNLWLVPAALRALRPDLAIGLFHHTPFPRPDVFRRIPAATQLLDSLRHLHWAGFHTPDCADNFRRLLADTRGPMPRTGVHPLGIDRTAVADLARARVQPHPRHDGGQLVLSVERLDYAKAPVHKIRALDDLLHQTPRLRGQIRFRLVCPPPEDGIHAYDSTRRELEIAITRLNGRWGSRRWQPVDYIPHNLTFPEVVDHYLDADVFWVTSLADGMNLTAQEYITTHHATDRPGVLILSRHAGIAQHLATAALLTDPLHPQDLVDVLRSALSMSTAERLAHMTRLADLLGTPPPAEWARTIITAIRNANSPHTT